LFIFTSRCKVFVLFHHSNDIWRSSAILRLLQELDSSIYTMYQKFDYDDEDIYNIDLDFLLNNIYNIKIVESRLKRIGQQEFRNKIKELYNYDFFFLVLFLVFRKYDSFITIAIT
jgi:hypothetical protein